MFNLEELIMGICQLGTKSIFSDNDSWPKLMYPFDYSN